MARLVVVATGGANSIRSSLGVNRKILSENHSMSFGFDIQTRRPEWHSSALTYYPESTRAKTAYMALFPMRSTVRANLFTYHDPRDPAVRYIKTNPSEALRVLLPEFERIAGNFDVTSPVDTRAVDLYKVDGAETSGAVFIGDAFSTSCPAAGTGVTKVLVDTQRLCDFYVPKWLSRRTIGKHTTEEFYKDSIRKANEKRCLKAAFHHRNFSTSNALWWQMRREIAYLRQTGRGLFQTQEQSVGSRFESDSTLGIS